MSVVVCRMCVRVDGWFVFFKQKTAYEMRISDWSSDVCSSDLLNARRPPARQTVRTPAHEQHHRLHRTLRQLLAILWLGDKPRVRTRGELRHRDRKSVV